VVDDENPGGDALPPEARAHLERIAQRLQEYAQAPTQDLGDNKLVDLMARMPPTTELAMEVRAAIAAVTAARWEREKAARSEVIEVIDFDEVVARRVRALRDESEWTQAALAQAMTEMGFTWSRVTVSEVEAGNRRVALDELLALAALFAVPLVTLFLPAQSEAIAFPRLGALGALTVREMVMGSPPDAKWLWTVGGADWQPARAITTAGEGDGDWRPARRLWESRLAETTGERQ
jgi:transcriptional regulator with XRE-family HTH domain